MRVAVLDQILRERALTRMFEQHAMAIQIEQPDRPDPTTPR
jgi:hypothetical protein